MIMDLDFRSWINKWKEPFQIIFSSLFSRNVITGLFLWLLKFKVSFKTVLRAERTKKCHCGLKKNYNTVKVVTRQHYKSHFMSFRDTMESPYLLGEIHTLILPLLITELTVTHLNNCPLYSPLSAPHFVLGKSCLLVL